MMGIIDDNADKNFNAPTRTYIRDAKTWFVVAVDHLEHEDVVRQAVDDLVDGAAAATPLPMRLRRSSSENGMNWWL